MTDRVEIPAAILGFSTMPNFYAIYHSSRNISISGLGGHIAISGSRSLLQLFGGTFFELVMVENPIIAVGISTLSSSSSSSCIYSHKAAIKILKN